MFDRHLVLFASPFVLLNAGSSTTARIAITNRLEIE